MKKLCFLMAIFLLLAGIQAANAAPPSPIPGKSPPFTPFKYTNISGQWFGDGVKVLKTEDPKFSDTSHIHLDIVDQRGDLVVGNITIYLGDNPIFGGLVSGSITHQDQIFLTGGTLSTFNNAQSQHQFEVFATFSIAGGAPKISGYIRGTKSHQEPASESFQSEAVSASFTLSPAALQ
jgi:hypothetical protein